MIMYDILFPSPNMISVGIKELLMNDDKNYKDVFNLMWMYWIQQRFNKKLICMLYLICFHCNAA